MTKEQLKYYIDNLEGFSSELEQRLSSISEEKQEIIDNLDLDSEQDYENAYEMYSEFCKDIFEKYQMNLEAFTTVFLLKESNRERIIGRDKSTQLLKDLIDIYGEQANDILGTNEYSFDISSLDGIIGGKDDEKYREFYTNAALNKCKKKYTLSSLSEVLLTISPEILSAEFLEESLSNVQNVYLFDINNFIENAPAELLNGNTMKILLNRTESIGYGEVEKILQMIPAEMYDKDFATQLLKKVDQPYNMGQVFRSIPDEIKDREMYEYAISKSKWIAYQLPEEKIEEMSDEEYQTWCEEQILGTLDDETDLNELMATLPEHLITERICTELIRKMPDDNIYKISELLKKVPESQRSRTLYEEFIKKSPELIGEIPEESFEEGLSQEEYDEWVESTILKAISESTDIKRITNYLPRMRYSEKVWNSLLDKATELGQEKVGINSVPIQNRTIEMYERAMNEISYTQIMYMPSIDRNLDEVGPLLKKEYESWISVLTEEQKQGYREWYEEKAIKFITDRQANIFSDLYTDNGDFGVVCLPKEAITLKMIQAHIDVRGAIGIESVPVPDEFTKYNEQYEDIVLYALDKLTTKDYENKSTIEGEFSENYDLLSKIPQEYRTDKVILEAVKKHPKYLNYANEELDNFEELLRLGYRNKLKQQGREGFTSQEIELLKEFKKNNANLFTTLNLDTLSPKIIECIGKESLERIVRYKNVQNNIIGLSKQEDTLRVFGFVLENLKGDNLFVEPLIESLSESLGWRYKNKNFIQLVSQRLQQNDIELSDEEKTIISYLANNPLEATNISEYRDISNFVSNKNKQFDEVMSNEDSSLIDVKSAYLERIVGMNYEKALEMVTKYGNDPEQLLAKYNSRELSTIKEKSEKEALEIIIKLKSLIEEKDIDKIREEYTIKTAVEEPSKSYTRYKQSIFLENSLKRAYGREMTQALSDHEKENNIETIEKTEDGKEYVVRKINGTFNRMVSVMDAYRKNQTDGNMYDKWNTNAMAENHALCYSFINETNPGTALIYDRDYLKKGIIISVEGFDPEAVIASAPYDLNSDSRTNTTYTGRQQRYFSSENVANQTRSRYSEYDIELQDVSEGVKGYQKIQPVSIICFETVDEDSIKAAIDLSEKLGRKVPIELIDRRELAQRQHDEIGQLLEQFKTGETLQPELVEQMITKFNNVRNSHMDSSLRDEILGERPENENLDAQFNKVHLNELLTQCIEVVNERIKSGNVQEGLETIAQIKQYIMAEREKNVLMPSMYEKQYMSGIDLSIDQQIDRIQRENGMTKGNSDKEIDSLRIVKDLDEMESITYQELYGKRSNMPEQLSVNEVKQMIDFNAVQQSMDDVKEKGYYSGNVKYSEEHIARVMMFSSAIANMEGLDKKQQQLLSEVTKYYSSGRLLDMKEQHEQYSAEIAGKELNNQYPNRDINIIQSVIELQSFHSNQSSISKQKEEYNSKLEDICNKHGISLQDKAQVDTLTRIIQDAVKLDKTRFIRKAKYNCPDEVFEESSFSTESAAKLMNFSYGIQDRLASEHLHVIENVAHIDFDSDSIKKEIMEDFFTETIMLQEHKTQDESIINSPIVREMFFRHKFSEIDSPETLGLELADKAGERVAEETVNDKEYNSESLVMAYQGAEITQEDVTKAYEQLSRTKNELEHSQDEMTLSEESK